MMAVYMLFAACLDYPTTLKMESVRCSETHDSLISNRRENVSFHNVIILLTTCI
jgi:hypothetical protein